ncbi:hypothetical protein EYF80_009555 [Liparis tanakae]|uniref:Uncharacterized protein n=1 Tax=Liparis tanakae TaxID=230148 RepID=A0A4Z2IQF8_9TELE|nr:hypothetical protein EYF80_009555 [Liparis tanakae]
MDILLPNTKCVSASSHLVSHKSRVTGGRGEEEETEEGIGRVPLPVFWTRVFPGVAQTEHSQPPDKPSRDAAAQQAAAQGQAYFVSLPARWAPAVRNQEPSCRRDCRFLQFTSSLSSHGIRGRRRPTVLHLYAIAVARGSTVSNHSLDSGSH